MVELDGDPRANPTPVSASGPSRAGAGSGSEGATGLRSGGDMKVAPETDWRIGPQIGWLVRWRRESGSTFIVSVPAGAEASVMAGRLAAGAAGPGVSGESGRGLAEFYPFRKATGAGKPDDLPASAYRDRKHRGDRSGLEGYLEHVRETIETLDQRNLLLEKLTRAL